MLEYKNMGGGLMQLVAYGAQDIYLTGNPQITFFKVVYRRHTNFSMETIEQTINGTSATGGGTGTVTISRNGDLVHKVYVTSTGNLITDGDEIVSEVELEIGGQRIDRHYKEWNQIWNELSTDESKAIGLKAMKGCVGSSGTGATGPGMVQVPLNFWFCRNPGLALPLIALQYHEVKLKFTWGAAAAVTSGGAAVDCKVVCDYIYLDTDERRRFAQVSHEYLIEQIQRQSADASKSVKLNFNHPVKELVWVSDKNYETAQLKLNGHDRFSAQEEEYFQLRQPFDYHTAVPGQNLPNGAGTGRLGEGGIAEISNKGALTDEAIALSSGVVGTVTAGTKFKFAALDGAEPTLVDGALSTTALTPIDLSTTTDPDNIIYIFATADVNIGSLSVGDTVSISVEGTGSFHGNATAQTIVTTVRSITAGTALTNVNNSDTVIQFTANLTDGVAAAGNVTINSIQRIGSSRCRTSQMTKKINVYSFALKPEEHQPSGTCNFSRIDTAKLDTKEVLDVADNIYAVNYNVLRIMSGMGGLAYSN